MLFKVGNEIVDTETTPVALIFKDKDEAKTVASILSNIKDGDTELPVDRNGNWWFMVPVGTSKSVCDEYSTLTEEQKDLLEKSGRISGKLDFQL